MTAALTHALGAALVRATLEGGLLVLAVMLVARLVPRLAAATRCALWWLACLRLVLALATLPAVALRLPALSAPAPGLLGTSIAATGHLGPAGPALAPVASAAATRASARFRPLHLRDVMRLLRPVVVAAVPYALALWLLGVLAVLVMHVRAAMQLERRWRAATPFPSARVQARLDTWLGARRSARVQIRTSTEARAPVLLAGWQPRILMPESCRALDESRFDLLLAHEAAHVRRHDLALGLVPALAHAVLWFFPLAHMAVEQYAQAREEACDADAVRAGEHALHPYGELLLAYGIDPQRRLHTAASYGSRHASRLHRRLIMLAHGIRPTSRQRALGLVTLVVTALIALLPVRLVAARSTHATAGGTGQSGSDVPTTSGQATAPRHAGSRGAGQSRGTTSASSPRHGSHSYGYSYSTDDTEDGFSFGYGTGDHMTLNGSFRTDDFRGVKGLGKDGREFGWFRLEGVDYVVYDADALARIREVMAPELELGERQGQLGERQGALGSQQGELGTRQGELGEQLSELSVRLGELETQLAGGRHSDARRSELRRKIAEVEHRIADLEAEQEELSDRQEALSKQQEELGSQQEELGQQQEELSRRSRVQMRKLADEFIQSGVATRRTTR